MTATVRVESDTSTLLRALSKTFTRSTTVISELLQNARRAGATHVGIALDETDLVITDNGCGIQDVSVLLSIAKSGWDASVQATDSPYGVGWISTLFCCAEVEVISKGQRLKAATEDLIAIRPIALQSASDDGTTQIRLGAHRLGATEKVLAEIKRLVAGFPLPVTVNGEMLDRPNALANREFIETPIGFATPGVCEARGVRQFYLQGLPISADSRSLTGSYSDRTEIVHLHSPMFEGRMPERDSLLEPETSDQRIRDALREVAKAHLTALSAQMPEMAFVAKYGSLAAKLEMHDLLNAMSHLPLSWVYQYDGTPIRTGSDGPSIRRHSAAQSAISRATLEGAGLFSVSTEEEGGDWETNLIAAHAVAAIDGFVADRVPAWHWAHALIQEVGPEDFTLVPGTVLGEDNLEVFYDTHSLRVVELLHIQRVDAAGQPQGEPVPTTCHFAPSEGVLYATAQAGGGEAVGQVSDFESEERYDEGEAVAARERFYVTRRVLLNNDPADLLQSFLDAGLPYSVPAALRDKRFVVVINDKGRASVTLVADGWRAQAHRLLRTVRSALSRQSAC